MNRAVDKLKEGMNEAIVGIIAAYVITQMLKSFVEDGLIPWYIWLIFVVAGAVGSWGLIEKFKFKVVPYLIGCCAADFRRIRCAHHLRPKSQSAPSGRSP